MGSMVEFLFGLRSQIIEDSPFTHAY